MVNMRIEYIRQIIKKGESIDIEFKESKSNISKDVYESVCAFLNRNGGHIFLGIKDNGDIVGVDKVAIGRIKKDFVVTLNNPQTLNPTFYLAIEEIEIDGKTILYINVPESSQVHRCKGRIFDRNEDGDFDITDNTNLVSGLYRRKQSTYDENRIFPYAGMEDLDLELFEKVRRLVRSLDSNHPWISMSNEEILRSAGLYLMDPATGNKGITLGGILLLGKEELIHAALPHHKTDAIVRKVNLDRYDDRDDIRVNLLKSYERLKQFVAKHIDDKFYLEGDQRISVRDKIFREAITNLLIHRDFANPFPAKFIIERDRVYIENSNRPHGNGIIDPENFSPFPKNPTIAKFFKEIGWVDELGSGVRKIFKYSKVYSDTKPQFIEGDIFKTIIYVDPLISIINDSDVSGEEQRIQMIIEYCKVPRSRREIQDYIGIKDRKDFTKRLLNLLIEKGLLRRTFPDKPTSPNQKYVAEEYTEAE